MGSLLKEHSLETDNNTGSDIPTCISGSGLVHVSGSQLLSALSGPRFLHQPALFLFLLNSDIKSPFKHEDLPAVLSNLFTIYSQTYNNDEHLVSAPASVLDTLDALPQFTLSTASRGSYTYYLHFKNKRAED